MSSTNSLLSPPNEKDSSKLWNDIVSAFREDGFPNLSNANGAIREELLSLYRRLASSDKEDDDTSTNPSKFVIAWEAFASNNADIKDDVKSIPNAENIESFREYILKDVIDVQKEIMRVGVVGSSKNQKKKKLSKFEKQAQKKARLMTMGEHLEMHDEDVDGKMEVKEEDSAEEEPLLKTPFKETTENNNSMNLPSSFVEMKTPGSYRKAKKKTSPETTTLVKTIFEGSSFKSSSSNAEKEITVKIQTSSSPHSTLFMRDRIEDKVALLKNKFKEEEDLKEEEEQEEEEQKGQIIGRVCCDSSDRQELQLESSDGSRVKLELRSVENEYSLFPGQIVKCVGANPTGYCFVAKEIDCYYFKQQQQIKQQQIKEEVQKTEMLLFSGPFTANDDLMYEPLDDVLHEASSKSPSIVLLMGPFVSDENINHALTSNITYKQAFEQIVMKKVEAFAKQYPNKHVVLVPSVKDAFHRYCAFPQPPFFETSKCKNVHFVANPSAFEVNGIRVAVSTCDILKHLSGFERGGKGKTTTEQQQQQQTDRMTRLCSHMVGQMSMYPLFPPHPDAKFESHDATVPLRVGMDERVPDLIVLTSDLAAGGWKNALSGNKTMFVNPGKVCRGVNAGTFCKISSSSGENFAESARLELHKL
ncbi:unnamed protein product [Bathycoccus prasinos]